MTNQEWFELAQSKGGALTSMVITMAHEAICGKHLDGQRCVVLLHDDGIVSGHVENPNTLDGRVHAGTALYAARIDVFDPEETEDETVDDIEEKFLNESIDRIGMFLAELEQKVHWDAENARLAYREPSEAEKKAAEEAWRHEQEEIEEKMRQDIQEIIGGKQ